MADTCQAATRRVLVLGGTTHGREIALRLLAHHHVSFWYALAGRTRNPSLDGIPQGRVLRAGLGGRDGLTRFLHEQRVTAVVDATHPFAAAITASAVTAARDVQVPYARYERARWPQRPGDHWHRVASTRDAIEFVSRANSRDISGAVLLTTGAKELPDWCAALGMRAGTDDALRVVARSIEAPACELPANFTLLRARGPFCVADEAALLEAWDIALVVSKLSGGKASYAKVRAARERGIPMLMIEPPALPEAHCFEQVDDIVAWAAGAT